MRPGVRGSKCRRWCIKRGVRKSHGKGDDLSGAAARTKFLIKI